MAEAPGVGEVDVLPTPKTDDQRELYIAIKNYMDQTNNAIEFLLKKPCATKTSDYTIVGSDYLILVDTTSGVVTITLPLAKKHENQEFVIKKTAGGNNVTVDGNGSETIDGSATQTISTQYDFIKVHSDGSNWHITGQND